MKILIAEDDKDQLRLRSMLLNRSGYETIAAATSSAALRAAVRQKPQCALVDWKFPTEELGLRLIRALKKRDAAMCVFVLTGGDPARFYALAEKGLVEEVLVKGSSTAYLLKKLRELSRKVERHQALCGAEWPPKSE